MRIRQKLAIAYAWVKALDRSHKDEIIRNYGKPPMDLTAEEALRIRSRSERRRFAATEALSLKGLVAWSGNLARARQTHPHKRGKRARR